MEAIMNQEHVRNLDMICHEWEKAVTMSEESK